MWTGNASHVWPPSHVRQIVAPKQRTLLRRGRSSSARPAMSCGAQLLSASPSCSVSASRPDPASGSPGLSGHRPERSPLGPATSNPAGEQMNYQGPCPGVQALFASRQESMHSAGGTLQSLNPQPHFDRPDTHTHRTPALSMHPRAELPHRAPSMSLMSSMPGPSHWRSINEGPAASPPSGRS